MTHFNEAIRGLLALGLVAAHLALISCSGSSEDGNEQRNSDGAPTVDQICDLILDECGAASDGFTRTECHDLGNEISINCMDCILESGCDYEEQCHDPDKNCELK